MRRSHRLSAWDFRPDSRSGLTLNRGIAGDILSYSLLPAGIPTQYLFSGYDEDFAGGIVESIEGVFRLERRAPAYKSMLGVSLPVVSGALEEASPWPVLFPPFHIVLELTALTIPFVPSASRQ